MKKPLKITALIIGLAGIAYGGFRLAEHFAGIIRLKYTVVRLQEFKQPPITTPLEE